MIQTKHALLVGAGVLGITAAGLGLSATTSALTGSAADGPHSNIIDTLANKFHLKRSEVKAVFDAEHADHKKAMMEKRTTALHAALTNGKITQAQYDHIMEVWKKIETLRSANMTDANHKDVHALKDGLHTWMVEQKINMSVMGHHPRGHGGHEFDR